MQNQPASRDPLDSSQRAPTALQQAIRARALDTLDNAERLPKPTRQRKLVVAGLVVATVAVLLLLIDFSVRVMHHILMMWYPEAPAQVQPRPVKPLGPNDPYYITVEPPADDSATASSK